MSRRGALLGRLAARGHGTLRRTVIPPPGTVMLSGSALADAVGSGLFLSGSVVYFSNRLGLSAVTIGSGLAIAGVAALLTVAPLGALADRVGYAHALRVVHLLRAVVYPLYLLVDGVAGFTAVVTVITIADRLAAPMFHATVGTTVGEDRRTETMGYVRALRNAGFSIGALATSAAIAVGTPTAYDLLVVGNAASFGLAMVLLWRVRNRRARRGSRSGPRLRIVRARYLGLSALNAVLLLHDMILLLALPLYVVKQTEVPASVLPLLFALNTVLVVVLQRWISGRAATVSSAARAEQRAGYCLAATCGCMAAVGVLSPVPAVAVLVLGVVLLTLGESLQVAGAWELSHQHAPEATRGTHLAVFSMGIGIQRSVGPLVLSLLVAWGAITWLPLAGSFVLAGTAMRRLGAGGWDGSRASPPAASTLGPT